MQLPLEKIEIKRLTCRLIITTLDNVLFTEKIK